MFEYAPPCEVAAWENIGWTRTDYECELGIHLQWCGPAAPVKPSYMERAIAEFSFVAGDLFKRAA